jgi:hypothetical protein
MEPGPTCQSQTPLNQPHRAPAHACDIVDDDAPVTVRHRWKPPHVARVMLSSHAWTGRVFPLPFRFLTSTLQLPLSAHPLDLLLAGHPHHTLSPFGPRVCTAVVPASSSASLQLEASATEAGLSSSTAASSSSRSSPSLATLHTPPATQLLPKAFPWSTGTPQPEVHHR